MLSKKEKKEFYERISKLKDQEEMVQAANHRQQQLKNKGDTVRFANLGLEFLAIFLLGLFGGQYLDGHFGTKPVLMITGIFLGFAIGLYRLIKITHGTSQ